MNVLIGLDLVDCIRCSGWVNRSIPALLKIFSHEEISYCMKEPHHAAARFAVRFAAREACYKALQALQIRPMPFLLFCRSVSVIVPTRAPHLSINQDALAPYYNLETVTSWSLSLTHSSTTAAAVVVVVIA
jgi:holo-[acyl-carrier protein] synthase